MNNYILIVLDSCRFDSFSRADPKHMQALGAPELRYSYASWTAPSHYNLLTGLMPHSNPSGILSSQYYRREFRQYNRRLGVEHVEFASMLPHLFLPTFLGRTLGYLTHAMVSLPVLNPRTVLNTDFTTYKLMPAHNDMRAMISDMKFADCQPSFFLMNVGETHYPYALPSEARPSWPHVHGVHGVFKHLDEGTVGGKLENDCDRFPTSAEMKEMRDRQVEAVRYLDSVFEELLDAVPPNTFITITADHGELFGEDGFFGHGPIMHPKVMEVPFLEGKIR